jgi:hypothetical protein
LVKEKRRLGKRKKGKEKSVSFFPLNPYKNKERHNQIFVVE